MLTVGSLFAGIGGFDLGFERAGFEIKWQVEIDPYCQAVLAKHWPEVKRYSDVRKLHAPEPAWVDVVCGGFPCQDISDAGSRRGIDGSRSGLWGEMARLVDELRPRYVVVENVAALLGRGMGRVLGDLAALGYDAEWECLPAAAFGAPHVRDRVWILAYSTQDGRGRRFKAAGRTAWTEPARSGADRATGLADAEGIPERAGLCETPAQRLGWRRFGDGDWWAVEPNVGRVAHGIPARVDRLRGLGNAIVPQIAEWIARRIADAES